MLAPGFEDSEQGVESMLRRAAENTFEIGSWKISPQLAVDFVDDEEVLIPGVVFGKMF